jgi:hypothetical protein
MFTHDTARPEQHLDGSVFADPQIHTHAVMLNLALRESDGTIGGIDTRLGPSKLMAGAVSTLISLMSSVCSASKSRRSAATACSK